MLVSAFPAKGGAPARIVELWLRHSFELILSEHLLSGTARAWARPYWAARYTPEQSERTLNVRRRRGTLVEPAPNIQGIAEDEDDDLVLATALAGNAIYLVTGDRRMRSIESFRGVTIVSPREFLSLFEQQESEAG